MRPFFLAGILFLSVQANAQNFSAGLFGGMANYQGDLLDRPYVGPMTRSAVGLTANYDLTRCLSLRAGLTFAKVAGHDKYSSKSYLNERNLSFESGITELSLLGSYNIFNIDNTRWTPYIFGGLALYRFNPYAKDSSGQKVYLKPLGTEGQGLDQYPERKPYSLTQLALPFGGGLKYAFTPRLQLGLEVGIRKLFTDYLDDVSTNYADEGELRAARGQQAVDFAYRGDELPGGATAYPEKGSQRGGSKFKDLYYVTGLHLTYRLGKAAKALANRGQLGCPTVD